MEEIDFKWPNGFFADGIHAGLRKKRLDMGWVVSEVPAQSAGVYTTNQFQAAPTKLTKETINKKHELQAIIMNSAVANSCTGIEGTENAHEEQALVASKLGIDKDLVGVASTGVIGVQLPMDKIKQGLAELQKTKNFKVTEAVLTTDTHSKTISVSFEIFGKTCTISGFCKGSGMIKPNMATMLGFVVTDAKVAGQKLQETLVELTNETFNQITVDGDTSTNDMVVVMANGQAMQDEPELSEGSEYEVFKAALKHVLGFLAKEIARDGEGATKLVEANVNGAHSKEDAQHVAKAIVGSNLVKAALFGEDANWGRIIDAIGSTNAKLKIDSVVIALNKTKIVEHSLGLDFDEEALKEKLKSDEIVIDVELNNGDFKGQAWGCDLTYKYVQINASYRS